MKRLSAVLAVILMLAVVVSLVPASALSQGRAGPAGPTPPVLDSEEDQISIAYTFPLPAVKDSTLAGFKVAEIPGLPLYAPPGAPLLPVRHAAILLPAGRQVAGVEVIPGKKAALGTFRLQPAQRPVPMIDQGPLAPTSPDPATYGQTRPYPGRLSSEPVLQWKCGCPILLVSLFPMEYIPATGELSGYEGLTLVVRLEPAAKQSRAGRYLPPEFAEREIKRLVENPGSLATYAPRPPAAGGCRVLGGEEYVDYVIITSEELAASFQPLLDHRAAQGYACALATVEDIYAAYDGRDGAEKIRNFIKDAYVSLYAWAFLLGGDADGADVGGESGDNIVPARGLWTDIGDEGLVPPGIPGDLYYACLDGSYDGDGDGVFGEAHDGVLGEDVDLYHDVLVGRVPADSVTEVENFVAKVIAYETTPRTDPYLKRALMVGERLDPMPTWGGDYKDEIIFGAYDDYYWTDGLPSTLDVSTLYDRDWPKWPPEELVDRITGGLNLINHAGHAAPDRVMRLSSAAVDALANADYFFLYSQGGYAGAFDDWSCDTGPGTPGYLPADCVAEHLICGPAGAVACVVNSRQWWYASDSTSGTSQFFDRLFWDQAFRGWMRTFSEVNESSKEETSGDVLLGDSQKRFCYYELNLLGDPLTELREPVTGHDLTVENVAMPTLLMVGQKVPIRVDVGNNGAFAEDLAGVNLYVDGDWVSEVQIVGPAPGAAVPASFTWRPTGVGDHYVEAAVHGSTRDDWPDDNWWGESIRVRSSTKRLWAVANDRTIGGTPLRMCVGDELAFDVWAEFTKPRGATEELHLTDLEWTVTGPLSFDLETGLVTATGVGPGKLTGSVFGKRLVINIQALPPLVGLSFPAGLEKLDLVAGKTQSPPKVTGEFEGGVFLDVTNDVTWEIADADIAVMDRGKLKGVTRGTTTLTAALWGSSTDPLDLNVALAIKRLWAEIDDFVAGTAPVHFSVGDEFPLEAWVEYVTPTGLIEGLALGDLAWTTSGAVSFDVGTGIATCNALGAGQVVSAVQGKKVIVKVQVMPPLAGVAWALRPRLVLNVVPGKTQSLPKVVAQYAGGVTADVSNEVTWEVDDAAVARVVTGKLKGVARGETMLRARYHGFTSDDTLVKVTPALKRLTADQTLVMLGVGGSAQITLTAYYSDGTSEDVTGLAAWTTNAPAVATVSGGQVTAVAVGPATIRATYWGRSVSVRVRVQ